MHTQQPNGKEFEIIDRILYVTHRTHAAQVDEALPLLSVGDVLLCRCGGRLLLLSPSRIGIGSSSSVQASLSASECSFSIKSKFALAN